MTSLPEYPPNYDIPCLYPQTDLGEIHPCQTICNTPQQNPETCWLEFSSTQSLRVLAFHSQQHFERCDSKLSRPQPRPSLRHSQHELLAHHLTGLEFYALLPQIHAGHARSNRNRNKRQQVHHLHPLQNLAEHRKRPQRQQAPLPPVLLRMNALTRDMQFRHCRWRPIDVRRELFVEHSTYLTDGLTVKLCQSMHRRLVAKAARSKR
mmetsp:Transcript_3587/g.7925  ORF Transcript_3587/g.7925 Transcript_3587/m.7925 type:complete len:207 (-) Transcript_3587:52-672(-)